MGIFSLFGGGKKESQLPETPADKATARKKEAPRADAPDTEAKSIARKQAHATAAKIDRKSVV